MVKQINSARIIIVRAELLRRVNYENKITVFWANTYYGVFNDIMKNLMLKSLNRTSEMPTTSNEAPNTVPTNAGYRRATNQNAKSALLSDLDEENDRLLKELKNKIVYLS